MQETYKKVKIIVKPEWGGYGYSFNYKGKKAHRVRFNW